MFKRLFFFLCLMSCGGPDPNKWPYLIQVIPWDDNDPYIQEIQKHNKHIEELLGCSVAMVGPYPGWDTIHFISYNDLGSFGVAVPIEADGSPGSVVTFFTGHGTNDVLWVATHDLPPQESQSGVLSACEVGYLYVWWLTTTLIANGTGDSSLGSQDIDNTKITYDHPNCPGYIPDIDVEFVNEMQSRHINLCKRK